MKKYITARQLKHIKDRAKNTNIPFNLTIKDVELPTHCPIFGVKFDSQHKQNAPTLDRIIPELGYIKGNVVYICLRANQLKGSCTPKELRKLADFYNPKKDSHFKSFKKIINNLLLKIEDNFFRVSTDFIIY